MRLIFKAPDMATARRLLQEVLQDYAERAPKAVKCLEYGTEDAMGVMAFPERYRKRLRTTNGVERLNQEVRRRERVIRIFPNEDSALRLLGAGLVHGPPVLRHDRVPGSGQAYRGQSRRHTGSLTFQVCRGVFTPQANCAVERGNDR